MSPKTRAGIWVALAMALLAAPSLALGFVRPTPLWLHVLLAVALSAPGVFAIMAAWQNYGRQ